MKYDRLTDYERQHLFEHLLEARRPLAVHQILADHDGDAYVWARYRRDQEGHYQGYLADLDCGRRAAVQDAPGWQQFLRYALASSSLAALETTLPAPLLFALYRDNLVQARVCVERERRAVDHNRAAEELIELTGIADNMRRSSDVTTFYEEGLEHIDALTAEPHVQAEKIRKLVAAAPDTLLGRIRASVQRMAAVGPWRSLCFSQLANRAPSIRAELSKAAEDSLPDCSEPASRALALVALGVHRGGDGDPYIREGLVCAQQDDDLHLRCRLLAGLAIQLPRKHLITSWPDIVSLPTWQRDTTGRWHAREHALEGYVPAFARAHLISKMSEAIGLMEELSWNGPSLVAVGIAASLVDPSVAKGLMAKVIPLLKGDMRSKLAELLEIGGECIDGPILARVIQEAFQLREVDPWFASYESQSGRYSPIKAARALLPHLPPARIEHLLSVVGTDAVADIDRPVLAEILLRAGRRKKALEIAEGGRSPMVTTEALAALGHIVSARSRSALLRRADGVMSNIADRFDRTRAELLLLPLRNPDTRADRLLQLSRGMESIGDRAHQQQFFMALSNDNSSRSMPGMALPEVSAPPQVHQNEPSLRPPPALPERLRKRIENIPTLSITGPYDLPTPRDQEIEAVFAELIQMGLFDDAARTGALAKSFAFGSRKSYLIKLVQAGGYRAALDQLSSLGRLADLQEVIANFPVSYHQELALQFQSQAPSDCGPVLTAFCSQQLSFPIGQLVLPVVLLLPDPDTLIACLSALTSAWPTWLEEYPDKAPIAFRDTLWSLAHRPRPVFLRTLEAWHSPLQKMVGAPVTHMATELLRECELSWP